MNLQHYLFAIIVLTLSSVSLAEQKPLFLIGNDAHAVGENIRVDEFGLDNIFAVGESISILTDTSGSLHLLGEQITVSETVGNSIYAAGQTISITGDVAQNVVVAGESVHIFGDIGNDLKVAAESVILNNDIGGDATIAAQSVEINSIIGGSVLLFAEEFNFSPEAIIVGTLTIYADNQNNIIIPSGVISPDRIIFNPAEQLEEMIMLGDDESDNASSIFSRFAFTTLLLFAVSFFMKTTIANAYSRGWSSFWKTTGYGILAYSVLLGSIFIFALTIIGLPISILLIFVCIVLAPIGYLMGNYLIVSRIWQKYRNTAPETKLDLAIVAGLSAASVLIITNIPGLGWWLSILVTLFGIGALTPWKLQPKATAS